jgi:hypothetical protein
MKYLVFSEIRNTYRLKNGDYGNANDGKTTLADYLLFTRTEAKEYIKGYEHFAIVPVIELLNAHVEEIVNDLNSLDDETLIDLIPKILELIRGN